jgi:hypothetical protein
MGTASAGPGRSAAASDASGQTVTPGHPASGGLTAGAALQRLVSGVSSSPERAAEIRDLLISAVRRGRIPADASSWDGIPVTVRRDLVEEIAGEEHTPRDAAALADRVGEWLAAGGVAAAAGVRPNLDDENLTPTAYRARLRAFNARARQLATPTATSRRLAARMRELAAEQAVIGVLPWDLRQLSRATRESLLEEGRDELGLTSSSERAGLDHDLRRPVDLAAMAELDAWLAARKLPAEPPRTAETHAVAVEVQRAIIRAVNAGEFDTGTWVMRNKRRKPPTSFEAAAGPDAGTLGRRMLAEARGDGGEPRPLCVEDRPVVTEVDEWLAAGMRPMPPGAEPLQREITLTPQAAAELIDEYRTVLSRGAIADIRRLGGLAEEA